MLSKLVVYMFHDISVVNTYVEKVHLVAVLAGLHKHVLTSVGSAEDWGGWPV